MIKHPRPTALRRVARAVAVTPAVLALTAVAPALAAPPDQWVEQESVSPLNFLLVLFLIPAGLFVVIALLASLGSSGTRGAGYHPGLAWRHEPEWFGGPRDGIDKAEQVQPQALEGADDRGGASGRW